MVFINWDLHRWETISAFSSFKDYLEMLENQFEAARECERARTELAPPPGLSEEDYNEWYFSECQPAVLLFEERYERDFPSKIRYSFIVLLQKNIKGSGLQNTENVVFF